jgi:quercetin dioxygenase-like cupin family protein
MKHITHISNLTFGDEPTAESDLQVEQLFDGPFRTVLHIRMRAGAILKKHKAAMPITVLCLSGDGIFRAGADLDESQPLTQGTLITLEPEVEHEAKAGSALHLLVTKFKPT